MYRTRKIIITFGVLIILFSVLYLWPVPKQDFATLFAAVPPEQKQSLLDFRRQHPHQTLEVNGVQWTYVAFGEGEKTVIFLHGMTGAYDIWWQQMETLADEYRVISVTYPPLDTLEELSEGVLSILDAEGIQKTFVVGTSLGGYLTQYLMANYPQRIEKAVLGNTFPPNDLLRQKNEKIIRILPFLPEWLVMSIFRKNFVETIYPTSGRSDLVLAYMLEQVSGRMSKAQVTARAKAVIQPFSPPDAVALGIPILIIESDNDPLVEASLREQMRATYPSAHLYTFHAAGHFPYLNHPETYTDLLKTFFSLEK